MKNEKVCCFILCFLVFLLFGCESTKSIPETVVTDNQRSVERVETTVDFLEGTITDSRERIRTIIQYSESITDGIDRLEYLFGEYQLEVEYLLQQIDTLRKQIKEQTNLNYNFDDSVNSNDSS